MNYKRLISKPQQKILPLTLSLAIVLSLLQGFALPAQAAAFTDVKGNEWYAADVLLLAENSNEIIKGFPDGSFKAGTKLTVDQFVTMLVRAAGEKVENHSGYWAINFLNRAKEMGILKDGDFDDFKAQITREEMAVLMIRFLEKRENLSGLNTDGVEKLITDFMMIGVYNIPKEEERVDAIKKHYVLGILTGYEDTNFLPQGILTRAEAATAVVRLLNKDRRVKYQPEVLKQKQQAEREKHYFGGSKWINPADTKISKTIQVREDRLLTSGKLRFSPYLHNVVRNGRYPDLSIDEIRGTIEYNNNSPDEGNVEDFEQLLLRRMPRKDVEKIMNYLRIKTSAKTHLPYEGTDFFVNGGKYLVRLGETIGAEEFGSMGFTVGINIWYMDEGFKKLYKKYYDYDYHKIK